VFDQAIEYRLAKRIKSYVIRLIWLEAASPEIVSRWLSASRALTHGNCDWLAIRSQVLMLCQSTVEIGALSWGDVKRVACIAQMAERL
jgi:hypothetical protein